ncbi:hypothetical protein FKM82_024452 [Ascaphus truei]
MGNQHNTHVANNYGKEVTVVVTHPNGRNDQILVQQGEVRNVATEHGMVTISIYDPETPDNLTPVEQRSIPSDYSVVILKSSTGKPKIVRVKYGSLWEPDPYDNQ